MYNLDISLLRTFLEVNKTRHFGKTAENLYLTQSAVSARIKQLEDILGVSLFQRYRNNIQLTPQGERLIPHAEVMLANWTHALQEVALPESIQQLVIAAPQSIWDAELSRLPAELLSQFDDWHIRAEAMDSPSIIRRLLERTLDIGFVFDQPKIDELNAELQVEIELKLYSSIKDASFSQVKDENFIMVDWGQSFSALLAKQLPNVRSPKLHATDWSMAIDTLTKISAFAFLPTRYVDNQPVKLFEVKDSPHFTREVFRCFHQSQISDMSLQGILEAIK